MIDVEAVFRPESYIFTVYVVEQRFVVGRGQEYFRKYINKPNYFDSDDAVKKKFRKIIANIEKNVAPVSKLISIVAAPFKVASIPEIITSLCKLFTVSEHQAAGPEVIDPIIIQEGEVSKKAIGRLVHLHKDCILRPCIIILLKDNDFERARKVLSECPNGINVKMIRNNGDEVIYRIVNNGAEDIDSFMSSFSEHCYSTCAKTNKALLLNNTWSSNLIVSKYSPLLLKYRANLMNDEKDEILSDLSVLIDDIANSYDSVASNNKRLLQSIECIAKLYRVFCNDFGGDDIKDAEKLARSSGIDVLLAQVYRYAELIPDCSTARKIELYKKGYAIFKENYMEDQAIYCKNNMLIEQFYSDRIYPEEFRALQMEAVNSVPGMVGMSHIYNNVGVAYLYCGNSSIAIDFFTKGLDYAVYQDRNVQNLALESNRIIAECYSHTKVPYERFFALMQRIFDGMGLDKLPFLSADYALNLLSAAYMQSQETGYDLVNSFDIRGLINSSFKKNSMGAAERVLQLTSLSEKYNKFPPLLDLCNIPKNVGKASGKRMEFITKYGFSPFDFNIWL